MKDHPQSKEAPKQTAYLTREELSARWQVSCMTLHRWRNGGRLPFHKLGRGVRFKLEDVERIERESRVSHRPVIDVVVTALA